MAAAVGAEHPTRGWERGAGDRWPPSELEVHARDEVAGGPGPGRVPARRRRPESPPGPQLRAKRGSTVRVNKRFLSFHLWWPGGRREGATGPAGSRRAWNAQNLLITKAPRCVLARCLRGSPCPPLSFPDAHSRALSLCLGIQVRNEGLAPPPFPRGSEKLLFVNAWKLPFMLWTCTQCGDSSCESVSLIKPSVAFPSELLSEVTFLIVRSRVFSFQNLKILGFLCTAAPLSRMRRMYLRRRSYTPGNWCGSKMSRIFFLDEL